MAKGFVCSVRVNLFQPDAARVRKKKARPQWMEHFRGRRRQRKLVERDLSRFVYCEDCDLYVENLEFKTHQNGSMHLGNVIKAGRLTERRR